MMTDAATVLLRWSIPVDNGINALSVIIGQDGKAVKTFDRSPGPTVVLNFITGPEGIMEFLLRQDELMKELGTGRDGTRVDKMISVSESRGFRVEAKEQWSIGEVKFFIDKRHPVIVLESIAMVLLRQEPAKLSPTRAWNVLNAR